MNTWKSAFIAVLMSGIVLGILDGHLVVWTCVGIVLGAVLALREHRRASGLLQVAKSRNQEVA